jgi:hypothetical protein
MKSLNAPWKSLVSVILYVSLSLCPRAGFSLDAIRDETSPSSVRDQLLVSTFLGGSGTDGMEYIPHIDMAVDTDGSIYVAGITNSPDFPTTPGVYQSSLNGDYDIFVAKFDSNLKTLIASSLLGGGSSEGMPRICLGTGGEIYIAGTTSSTDFPTTAGAIDTDLSGDEDFFVAKMDGDLTTLHASTYLGGTGTEGFPTLALDHNGNLFVGGYTTHGSFPTTAGAFNEQYNGGDSDLFVAKFNSDLSAICASTFIGGMYQDEFSVSLAVNGAGEVYLLGTTGSYDYPTTPAAYDTSFNGPHEYERSNLDVCVSKLNNDLTVLLASTFIGGTDFDRAYLLSLDTDGHVLVSGHMSSTDFPTTPGVLDDHHNGFQETFVSRLDGDLATLLTSTYLTPNDIGFGYVNAIGYDGQDNVWLFGMTDQTTFPVTEDAFDASFNGGQVDATLMKLNGDFSEILYATFLGGSGRDLDNAMAVNVGEVLVAGYTVSSNFPVTEGSYDPSYNGGGSDCYVARFAFEQFTRITEGEIVNDGGSSQGVSWIDYDNDGYLDMFVSNLIWPSGQDNWLYHNAGDGTFEKMTGSFPGNDSGLSRTSTWGDFDNDGDPDCFVSNWPDERNFLYINEGDGSFSKVTSGEIVNEVRGSPAAGWGDYDNDGDLDLFVANYGPNSLFRNDGQDFTKITSGDIATDVSDSYSAAWADYDNDGDLDLFVTSNYVNLNNYLYTNNGDGTFDKVTGQNIVSDGGESFGGSWGDYDNDGDLDLFVPNISYSTNGNNFLYNNNGDGIFTRITEGDIVTDGGYSFGSAWGDYDNDGDLDLFVANYPYHGQSGDFLYENNADGTFTKVTGESVVIDEGASYGAAWGDYDRDGDLDLFVAKFANGNENNALYRNNGNSNHWMNIKCIGTFSNASAIGAKVRTKATINGHTTWQLREISAQTGYCSQNSLNAHFGLSDATVIDSIKIEWPSGMIDILTNVDVNQFLTVREGQYGDVDGDGIADINDNCPDQFNPEQIDSDTDGVGDVCDNCPAQINYDQADGDGDGTGDVCDTCTDTDNDGYGDPGYPVNTCDEDNCPEAYNPDQADVESGDIDCDGDINVLDVLAVVNNILGMKLLLGAPFDRADCNGDGSVNVLDALSIVNIILGIISECPGDGYRPAVTPEVIMFCQALKNYLSTDDFEQFMSLVKGEIQNPLEYCLVQNYPNPFNPRTDIRYQIIESRYPIRTTLKIYNILGQEVRTLVDEVQEAGYYTVTWDGTDEQGRAVSSGVYYYRFTLGEYREIRKMLLLK